MKIGLVSDVHAAPEPLAEALNIFARAGVSQILCAGDIAGYNEQLDATIDLLHQYNCQSVIGNHDIKYLDQQHKLAISVDAKHHNSLQQNQSVAYLQQLPASLELEVEGQKLYMVHAQPPDGCHGGIKLLDKNGCLRQDQKEHWQQQLQFFKHDILIVGHTHQVFVETIANTLVVNPGSSVFNNSCAILSLPEMSVELYALSGKKIEVTWNWGEHVIYGKH